MIALALAAAAASADETLPVPAAAPSLRALFAVEGTRAVPLACFEGGRPIDRFRCAARVPAGAEVRLDDGRRVAVAGRAGAACRGEVDPFPSLRLAAAAPRAIYAIYAVYPAAPAAPLAPLHWVYDAHRHSMVLPLPLGDDAAALVQSRRRGGRSVVTWSLDGAKEERVDERAGRLPTEVVAAFDLDGDGAVELLLRVPGRKTWLLRRGPRGWEHVGGWGCRD